MAREQYQQQLKDINTAMMDLAEKVEEVMKKAVHALLLQEKEEAEEIIRSDDTIDECVREIDRMCYDVLLRQQPVASDLRRVSSIMKVLTDLERVGDHAVDISELTLLMIGETYPEIIQLIQKMSGAMMAMLYQAISAFASMDSQEAKRVAAQDDVVDALFVEVKNEIGKTVYHSMKETEVSLDLLMVAKYFERVSDHATNIAEWVIFSETGEFPNN